MNEKIPRNTVTQNFEPFDTQQLIDLRKVKLLDQHETSYLDPETRLAKLKEGSQAVDKAVQQKKRLCRTL